MPNERSQLIYQKTIVIIEYLKTKRPSMRHVPVLNHRVYCPKSLNSRPRPFDGRASLKKNFLFLILSRRVSFWSKLMTTAAFGNFCENFSTRLNRLAWRLDNKICFFLMRASLYCLVTGVFKPARVVDLAFEPLINWNYIDSLEMRVKATITIILKKYLKRNGPR